VFYSNELSKVKLWSTDALLRVVVPCPLQLACGVQIRGGIA
jgi:hypothetical protein